MKAGQSVAAAKSWSWLFAVAVLAGLSPAHSSDALTEYRLDCMGCHLADGSGALGKVPDMRPTLALFALTQAGRRYLISIPGSAQAPLSDAQLANLLNWMVDHLSAKPMREHFVRFSTAEVARYRRTPLVQVSKVRQQVLAGAYLASKRP